MFNFFKPTCLASLLYLLPTIAGVFSVSAEPEPVIVCRSSSPKDMNMEINLVDRINRIKIDTDRAVGEIDALKAQIEAYSKKVDRTYEEGRKFAAWFFDDPTKIGLLNMLASDYLSIPGLDLKLQEKGWSRLEFDVSKSLTDLTKAWEVLTPSKIADWIEGTSTTLANTKLTITSNAVQAQSILSEQLRVLRKKCEQDKARITSSEKPPNNNSSTIANSSQIDTPPSQIDTPQVAPISPFEKTPFMATIVIGFPGDDREQIAVLRDQILKQLDNPPYCSYLAENTYESETIFPIWQTATGLSIQELKKYEFLREYVNSRKIPEKTMGGFLVTSTDKLTRLWKSFGKSLVFAKVIHEDDLQIQYSVTYISLELNSGSVRRIPISMQFTFFKDRRNSEANADPSYMKRIFYDMVNVNIPMSGLSQLTLDKSSIGCNF